MKVGFTGTAKGMNQKQIIEFKELINKLNPKEFHHGDCIGADTQAHGIVSWSDVHIIIHPPSNSYKRGFNDKLGRYEKRKEKPYLIRNHDIVDETDVLIACPKGNKEEIRSGTWATIRYAEKKKKNIHVLWR